MGERAGELRPLVFWGTTPPDGTLITGANSATPGTTYATPRDRYHVFPFLVNEPPVGAIWRLDSIWIQNVTSSVCYVSCSVSNVGLTRGLSAAMQYFGTILQPTTHFRFGAELGPGETDAIDAGGLLVRGRVTAGATDAEGLWAACYPGLNTNPAGVGNDGVPPGATVSFHGVVLT